MRDALRTKSPARLNAGFTLVELLIAIGILLILTTMSVAVYSMTTSADRIRSSARQVQSALGGARDREIKAIKTDPLAKRGLRFLVDSADPTTVTSMVYVGSDAPWTDGQIIVGRPDVDGDGKADSDSIRTVRGWPKVLPDGSVVVTGWLNLYNQGLLVNGSRIRIPKGSAGTWYTVSINSLINYSGSGPEILTLTTDYRNTPPISNYPTTYDPGADFQPGTNGLLPGELADDDQDLTNNNPQEKGAPFSDDITDINAAGNIPSDYELELKPTVLPSQEPLRLSGGIAIDLYNSTIPRNWYEELSFAKGAPLPPADQRYEPTANMGMGGYVYNGWGVWSIEGTDPSNPANDIYRQYSPRMDVMFSPQGSVTGPLATIGMIHLRLAEVQDIGEARDPANPQSGTMLYSTVYTQTGYVATFPVNITDSNSDGYADDPLYFARIGGTVGR